MNSKKKTPSKADVLDTFSQGASDIGLDKKSSDIIVANLNATTLPMCVGTPISEIETDDVTLIFFILDQSSSMEPVEQDLISGFNDILIPGLKGGSQDIVSTIEIGGLVFNYNIQAMWGGGFQKLEDLPPLTKSDYSTSGSTALHQAVLDAFTAVSVRTTQIMNELGIPPKVMFVILSDGANNNPPDDPADVKKVADSLSNEIFVKAFAGFETWEPVDFKQIAKDIGFGKPFEMKKQPGESDDEMKRRFRHLLGIMSSSLVTQSKTQVTPDSSSAFWQSN